MDVLKAAVIGSPILIFIIAALRANLKDRQSARSKY